MADWLDYEKLAAKIYRELQPGAQIQHNDKLMGYESGTLRQIDVSIKTNVAGHNILVIVQAKNHKSPLDVNTIGEFLSVIKDVRAQKGIMICNAGFTRSAIRFARAASIDLCTLHDTQSPSWGINLTIPLLWVEYDLQLELHLEMAPDRTNPMEISLFPNPDDWKFSDDAGIIIPNVLEDFMSVLRDRIIPWQLNQPYRAPFTKKNLRILFNPDFWMPIKSFDATVTVTAKCWRGSYKLSDCRGLYNRVDEKLTAHMRIDYKSLPTQKDPSWEQFDNFAQAERDLPHCLVVEQWPARLNDCVVKDMSMENSAALSSRGS